jgi:hypothetical protein
MYWNFAVVDGAKATELVADLLVLRPGLMDLAMIEIDFHDIVDVE